MIMQELKKIFEVKRVLMIFILAVLFYILFFQKNVGIPDYSSDWANLQLSVTLREEYGNEIDQNEYRDLQNSSDYSEENKIDTWIKGNDDFKQYGVGDYADLLAIQDSLSDEAAGFLISQISARFTEEEQQEALDHVWMKDYMESLAEAYDMEIHSNQKTSYYSELSEKNKERLAERNQEEVYSLMPDSVMRNYLAILPDFAIFLFLSMILLIVPYSVKDTMEGINILQYTSPKGCKFYWKKSVSVFVGSIILCAVEVGSFVFMLRKNGTFYFVDCFVSGFRNPFITFMKLTFGQYIMMSLVYMAVIGLCLSMITYCLSSCAHNYISAIAFQIPGIIFSILVALMFISHFAEMTQNVMLLFLIPFLCFLTAVIGNLIRFLSIKFYEQI